MGFFLGMRLVLYSILFALVLWTIHLKLNGSSIDYYLRFGSVHPSGFDGTIAISSDPRLLAALSSPDHCDSPLLDDILFWAKDSILASLRDHPESRLIGVGHIFRNDKKKDGSNIPKNLNGILERDGGADPFWAFVENTKEPLEITTSFPQRFIGFQVMGLDWCHVLTPLIAKRTLPSGVILSLCYA